MSKAYNEKWENEGGSILPPQQNSRNYQLKNELKHQNKYGDTMKPENAKEDNQQTAIVMGMSHVLADSYTFYLKTQNYHWNVTGHNFHQLHSLFEAQYKEMAIAIDEIAERIRALGHRAPGSFSEFQKLSSIAENTNKLTPGEMISDLIKGNEIISKKSEEVSLIAKKYHDEVSSGLLISRIQAHEKSNWILRSFNE